MKSIKKIHYAVLALLAIAMAQTSFAAQRIYPALDENLLREEITVATEIAEIKKNEALAVIKDVRQRALQGTISSAEAIKTIQEYNNIIIQVENELAALLNQSIEEVKASDAKAGYLSSIISGAQDLATRAIAPLKSGYGYTAEQKEMARKVIDGLLEQQTQLTRDYELARVKLNPGEKRVLKNRYEKIIAGLNDDIYQQQLITGDVMSTERKLFWAAVAAGAAIAGLAAGKYLLMPGEQVAPEVAQKIEEPVVQRPSVSVVQQDVETKIQAPASVNVTPADVTPVNVTPADVTPVNITPADVTPVNITPADVTSVNITPVNITPADVTPVNITPADVTSVDVTPVNITPADVTSVDVTSVDVTPADVTSADVTSADVTSADVTSADVTPADVTPADVTSVNITPVNITPADVTSVDVTSVDVTSVDVTPADVTSADVTSADVTPADVTPADVTPADVTPADVTPADVTSADVTSADVTSADVTPADVTSADVTPADVTSADVTSADVTPADVTPADVTPVDVTPVEKEVITPAAEEVVTILKNHSPVKVDGDQKKKVETDEKPEYPGFFRHLYNQAAADVQSLREGKIPRPIPYYKK